MTEGKITYKRRSGTDPDHGTTFEWHTTALAYLRCEYLHQEWKTTKKSGVKSFFVANNMDNIGAFDDVVVRVVYPEEENDRTKLIFVQCKHVLNPKCSQVNKYEEYLHHEMIQKYFDSFIRINKILKGSFKVGTENETLKNMFQCNIYDCDFVLYSNVVFDGISESSNVAGIDIATQILNTAEKGTFSHRLKEERLSQLKCKNLSEGEFRTFKQEFLKRFRIAVNQIENINIEMKTLIEPRMEDDFLTLLNQEIRLVFRPSSSCTPLTEKTQLLDNIKNYWQLRNKSQVEKNEYRAISGSKLLFSNESITKFHDELLKKCSMEINTYCFQLIKLKLIQTVNSLFNSMLVFIDNETVCSAWMGARETHLYENTFVNSIIVYSSICMTLPHPDKKENETIIEIKNEIGEEMKLISFIENFSIETKSSILVSKVCFQGFTFTVNQLGEGWLEFFDETLICKILKGGKVEIGTSLPKVGVYLERKLKIKALKHRHLLASENKPTSSNENFVLLSNEGKNIPGYDVTAHWFENICEARDCFQSLPSIKDDTIYFCSFYNQNLQLIYSTGNKAKFTETQTEELTEVEHTEVELTEEELTEEELTEEELIESRQEKIIILNGSAGFGKTITLKSLAIRYKTIHPGTWVYFIELNRHLNSLKKFAFEVSRAVKRIVPTDAIEFVASKMLSLIQNELTSFVKACHEGGNIVLFFDAFDEISPDAEKILRELLLELEKTKIERIFISSRPNYVEKLERYFLHNAVNFMEFKGKDKENFLYEYWKSMLIANNINAIDCRIKNAAYEFLESLVFEKEHSINFLAIPLHLKMIAEIYFDKNKIMLQEKQQFSKLSINLVSLYDDFINLHIKRFCVDKKGMDWENEREKDRAILIYDKLKYADAFACKTLFPDLVIDIDPKEDMILKLRDQLGIIVYNDPVEFLHRTFAEFLSAKYLVKQITAENDGGNPDIPERAFLEKDFEVLRKFINCMLFHSKSEIRISSLEIRKIGKYGNTSLHISALENNVEILKLLIKSNTHHLNEKNKSGQTPLHIACEVDDVKAVECLVTKAECLVDLLDRSDQTSLHYASKNGNKGIIELLLKRDKTLLNFQDINGDTPLHCACQQSQIEAATYLFSEDNGSALVKNKLNKSSLYYAEKTNNEKFSKFIQDCKQILATRKFSQLLNESLSPNNGKAIGSFFEHQGELKEIIEDGVKYPLHYASGIGNVEVMNYLLEIKPALLNEENEILQTALHEACKMNQTTAIRYLLGKEECIVNKVDCCNRTPLHYAAEYDNVQIIWLLLHRSWEQINKSDNNGETPLQIAEKYNNIEVVELLKAAASWNDLPYLNYYRTLNMM